MTLACISEEDRAISATQIWRKYLNDTIYYYVPTGRWNTCRMGVYLREELSWEGNIKMNYE